MTSSTPPQPAWRRLPVADNSPSPHPIFFFTFQRHAQGLELHVSDLIHIWRAAQTSKEALHAEAARTRCRIDPSEDAEQYEVLIGKLEDALCGRDGASVRVVGTGDAAAEHDHDNDNDASALVHFDIETSMPLPAPLGVLKWTFRMVRQGPAVFTRGVVLPALGEVEASRRREEQLRRVIREKDHVIGRLMDRIEGAGMDLAMVFPGVVGARKGLNSRLAEELVPGIRAFKGLGELEDGDCGVLREVMDSLRDPETGEVVWRGLNSSGSGLNHEQQGLGKHEFEKETNERDQVKVVSSLLARKFWLTDQRTGAFISPPSLLMILILLRPLRTTVIHSTSPALQHHHQRIPKAETQIQSRRRRS
jgi:XLF-Cernunnos, XRcc4-like factor, NHEJ component